MDKRMEQDREGLGRGSDRSQRPCLDAGSGARAAAWPGTAAWPGAVTLPGDASKAEGGTAASALDAAIKAALAGGASLAEVEEELERRARRGASAFPRAPLPAGIH